VGFAGQDQSGDSNSKSSFAQFVQESIKATASNDAKWMEANLVDGYVEGTSFGTWIPKAQLIKDAGDPANNKFMKKPHCMPHRVQTKEPHAFRCYAGSDGSRPAGAVGEGNGSQSFQVTSHERSRPPQDRRRSAGEMGEAEGSESETEKGGLTSACSGGFALS